MFAPRRSAARRAVTLGVALLLAVTGGTAIVGAVAGAVTVTQIASDPFQQSNAAATATYCKGSATTNHQANVEPDTYSWGSTIVAAFQVGRIYNGGACAIGFATSTDNGATWTSGLLPGLTKWTGSASTDASWIRATDASVAYDAKHGVWLVSSLVLSEGSSVKGLAVVTSSSSDGGLTWGKPVVTNANSLGPDKNWIVCDNSATSPYYGNCYTEWDDNGAGNKLYMSTSSDGGATWSAKSSNNAGVIGGQPVVRPDGTVIVPTANANETGIGAFFSTDGGATWSAVTTIATVRHHTVAGSLREGPLPSAEIDASGGVYVTWSDCRFRTSCRVNDIVFSKSLNATGTSWSAIARIPIDATNSGIDHFIPGLAVDRTTSGSSARLGLTYYFYPSGSTQLSVGFISSSDGGTTWSAPQTVTSGMKATWAATTSQGRMVGDYISTSFDANHVAHGVYGAARTPTTGSSASCSTTGLDNCRAPIETFAFGPLAPKVALTADPILWSGTGGAKAASLWNLVDNNGIRHRD